MKRNRLIDYGELKAQRLPGSSYWKIPLGSVLAFEERRAESDRVTAEWSRDLDAMAHRPSEPSRPAARSSTQTSSPRACCMS